MNRRRRWLLSSIAQVCRSSRVQARTGTRTRPGQSKSTHHWKFLATSETPTTSCFLHATCSEWMTVDYSSEMVDRTNSWRSTRSAPSWGPSVGQARALERLNESLASSPAPQTRSWSTRAPESASGTRTSSLFALSARQAGSWTGEVTSSRFRTTAPQACFPTSSTSPLRRTRSQATIYVPTLGNPRRTLPRYGR